MDGVERKKKKKTDLKGEACNGGAGVTTDAGFCAAGAEMDILRRSEESERRTWESL